MIDLVNNERMQVGLALLELDYGLAALARMKVSDMIENCYFGHCSDIYGNAYDMVIKYKPGYIYSGENLALKFKDHTSVHHAWMCSTLHRRNILDKNYSHFGCSWAELNEDGRIYVQIFAGHRLVH